MAKKKTHTLRNGIIAVTIGVVGAALTGLLSNKTTRTKIVKEVKRAEKKVIAKTKKKK
jgi:hypothetical protein